MIIVFDNDLLMQKSAGLSEDGVFRYFLARIWGPGPIVVFIMLNPSTADASKDDPTIRRCIGFAQKWKYGGVIVVNLFAFRATKPKALKKAEDPVGPENDEIILEACTSAGRIVGAWGAHGTYESRDELVENLLLDHELLCLRKTKKGHPEHPLYIPSEQVPIPFEVPVEV